MKKITFVLILLFAGFVYGQQKGGVNQRLDSLFTMFLSGNYQTPGMYGVTGDFAIADTGNVGFSRDDAAVFDSCATNGNTIVLDGGNYYIA